MPRNRMLTTGEFHDLTKKDMLRIYNQAAERVNKQIQRLQNSGVDYSTVYSKAQRAPVFRKGKTTYKGQKITRKMLEQQYNQLVNGNRYTKTEVQRRLEQNRQLAKSIAATSGGDYREIEKTITPEQSQQFNRAIRRATSTGAYYYQVLKRADELGILDLSDYGNKVPDKYKSGSKLSYTEAIDDLLDQIEEHMEDMDNQKRTKEDRAELEQELKNAAYEFEFTTGEERRGFQKMNTAQIRELEKLFGR